VPSDVVRTQLSLVTTQMELKVILTWVTYFLTHKSQTTGSHSPSLNGISIRRIFLTSRGLSWQVPNNPFFLKSRHVRLHPNFFQLIFRPYLYPSCYGYIPVKFFSFHIMKAYRGIRGIAPLILYHGTGWRQLAIFTSRSIYLRQITPVRVG
jgi:hypothetical protein